MGSIEAADLWQHAVDTLPMNFAVLDEDGTILQTNQAWSEFATENDVEVRPEMVGVNYLAVTEAGQSESAAQAAAGLKEVLDGDRDHFEMEYPCHSPEKRRWFSMRVAPFAAADQRYVAVVHIDITERKLSELKTEKQAETLESQREQLELLNRIIRHDIRNDMNVVLGAARDLEGHVDSDRESLRQMIEDAGTHVVSLTKTTRDLVEVIGTSEDVQLEPTDVGEVLETEVEKRTTTFPDATFVLLDDVPHVDVRANTLLSSVFRNVLNNAVQHNRSADPRIEISADVTDETAVVRIADNGPGIPDAQKDAIFGRTEAGIDDPAAGVGLYLVDMLLGQYGGDVWVEDNEPEGSVFVVELPRYE